MCYSISTPGATNEALDY